MQEPPSAGRPFTVLFVCTGNICRSALAERLGRAYLEDALGDDASAVRLQSAGTRAVVGSGVHPDSALVLRGFGGDPEGFAAQQLAGELVMDADLVLVMTRGHRHDVLTLAPRALARTFTVREAAALLRLVRDDVDLAGQRLPERARALVKELATARARRPSSPDDDVADPMGLRLEAHQEAGDVIAEALLPLLARLAALARNREAPAGAASTARNS